MESLKNNKETKEQIEKFIPNNFLLGVTAIFGFLHTITGATALFLEKDLLFGLLLETDSFRVPPLPYGTWQAFLRGPKKNGRGTAPNVRAWGARQLTISVPFWFALVSFQKIAFQIAFISLITRITGDILQNFLDGCYWKILVFAVFWFFAFFMVYNLMI